MNAQENPQLSPSEGLHSPVPIDCPGLSEAIQNNSLPTIILNSQQRGKKVMELLCICLIFTEMLRGLIFYKSSHVLSQRAEKGVAKPAMTQREALCVFFSALWLTKKLPKFLGIGLLPEFWSQWSNNDVIASEEHCWLR